MTRRRLALLLFAAALLTRLLFWQATADRDWAWSAFYKGDAPLWIEYAYALQHDQPFELGLPIHPPGTAWLGSLLWNGRQSGMAWLRFAWVLLGACIPLLVFLAADRAFGLRAAAIAGGFTTISTGLMILSASIDSETPYLVLVVASFWLGGEMKTGRQIAIWSALNGMACLFRVDHLLFSVLALAFFAIRWRAIKPLMVSLIFFALPLVPWHLHAWSAIRRFNEEPRQLTPVEEHAVSSVEQALQDMPWTEDARRRRDELPGFVRRTGTSFVTATVYFRGGRTIRGEDFSVLEEAFGYFPRPLQRFPFVSLYGPLNFYLANNPQATSGFDRSPLDAPPPLAGGPSRYPSFLIQGLPPAQLSFVYPPHLRLFNEGYAHGRQWIADHPRHFARLAARKASHFLAGATHGVTGYGVPAGLSGMRRAVDLVAPEPPLLWQIAILALSLVGIALHWRNAALWPWLLFLASKIAVAILFFGYARQGALVIPVLAVLIGLAASRWNEQRTMTITAIILVAALATEIVRFASRPSILLDGGFVDPVEVHRDHIVEVR
jgi:hypothetical protein